MTRRVGAGEARAEHLFLAIQVYQSSDLVAQPQKGGPGLVFFAITPKGLQCVSRLAAELGGTVWCSADAISVEEYSKSHRPGLSRFNYALGGPDSALLNDALQTIEEHHPGAIVWVEGVASA